MKVKAREENIEEELKEPDFVLFLYIIGASPNSIRAVENIQQICEDHLKGRYSLKIVDVHQQADLARNEQLIALPVLIRKFPAPERRLVGDMSETEKVLKGLGLQT